MTTTIRLGAVVVLVVHFAACEKRLVLPSSILATCGALAGALFSHYMLFPSA